MHNHRLIISLLAFLILAGCNKTEPPLSDDRITFIWQGFYHDWTYNHRVNRMGDWIDNVDRANGYRASFIHSAASGIGADELSFTTFAAGVRTSADVDFISGSVEAVMSGMEGNISETRIPVALSLDAESAGTAVVLLSGFDMYSRPRGSADLKGDGQADKLFHLEIRPENLQVESGTGSVQVTFDIFLAMGADCSSPECSSGPVNDWFDYNITTAYQVIHGQPGTVHFTPGSVYNDYSWERPVQGGSNEIYRADYTLADRTIQGGPEYQLGVAGISSLYFHANKGFGGFDGQSFEYPHMLNFDAAIRNNRYTPETGLLTYDADLFFKNWTSPIPPVSFGGGGSVDWELTTELVQISDEEGIFIPGVYSGSIVWLTNPFDPAPPTTPASLEVRQVEIPLL